MLLRLEFNRYCEFIGAGLGDRRIRQHDVAYFGGNCGLRLALVGEVRGQIRNVRFTPESGHSQCNSRMSALCHVWTAPSWQELSSRLQHWSVQPCVRPVSAAHEAAGHNALRGSGPGQ